MAKFVKPVVPVENDAILQFPSDVLITLEEKGSAVDIGGYYGRALNVTRRGEFKGSFVYLPDVAAEDLDVA